MSYEQRDLFETEEARSLLGALLSNSQLYTSSKNYHDLLGFVARMRNFALFNAMLLNIQKPGLSHAASESAWNTRFGRKLKSGARPLIIVALWARGAGLRRARHRRTRVTEGCSIVLGNGTHRQDDDALF